MLLEGNLNGVQHLGIFVADIEQAKAWYVRHLGFVVTHEKTVDLGQEIKLAFLELGSVTLELVQPSAEDVSLRGHGSIDHFAIDTLDIESAMQTVLDSGAALHASTADGIVTLPDFGPKGTKYVFFEAANGEKVELAQSLHSDPARRAENIYGWNHLGVFVSDLAASKAFYEQFGFTEVIAGSIAGDGGTIQISMMGFNGFVIELVQLFGDDLEEVKGRKDGLLDHIALDVNDIHAAYDELKAAGMTMLQYAPVPVPLFDHGVHFFMIAGPDGEKVEFNQISKE
jgi:catechol 2,3-dioxygenase-like lactoylglutathione lyase family enzyme